MIITKDVVVILSVLSPFVFEVIDWFVEVIGVLPTNKCNGAVVGLLAASMNDGVIRMIDEFVRDIEVESNGKIIGKLEGADVSSVFNATEGSVVVLGLSVGSIVENSLQVVLNVLDIAIGSSVIIFWHVSSV